MSQWEMSKLRPDSAGAKESALERVALNAMVHALGKLDVGRIVLRYGTREIVLGSGDLMATIRVNDPRFFSKIALGGAIGAAEAYRCGWWEADDLTMLFRMLVRRIGRESPLERWMAWLGTLPGFARHLARRNTQRDSKRNIEVHYDLGNDFFKLFLDPTMTYSCGFFDSPLSSLEGASESKLHRIAQKLDLRPGMRVLEIGCGWGSFAILAARDFGCEVFGVTLSSQQYEEANRRIRAAELDHLVEIQLKDYRDVSGRFDRVVSIEMIEAIGQHRLSEFFGTCANLLKPDGLAAIQVITMPDQGYQRYLRRTDVIRHLVFPGSTCPSRTALLEAATRSSPLRLVHLQEIGPHYAKTLQCWRARFVARLEEAITLGYPPEFLRLWHFYLSYCEAGFAERHIGDIQALFAMPGYRGDLDFLTLQPSLDPLDAHQEENPAYATQS